MSNGISYRDVGNPTIISVQERYPHLARTKPVVDHRGEQQTETQTLPPYGAPSRGPVERRVISREEALTARAAQGAAQQATSDEVIAALRVELQAQRDLATRQAAQIQQLLERLDAIDGSPEAA
jgi:hypothetical protein